MGIQEIRKLKEEADKPKEPKKRKPIPKTSKKRRAVIAAGDDELDKWFDECRAKMTGRCVNCGRRSSRDDNKYFKFSIAHILPKAYFESVKTHSDNWIEICFWGEGSCHTNMDNKMLDLVDMACWDEIVIKFQKMYPSIAKEERKRIPEILLQYINTDL